MGIFDEIYNRDMMDSHRETGGSISVTFTPTYDDTGKQEGIEAVGKVLASEEEMLLLISLLAEAIGKRNDIPVPAIYSELTVDYLRREIGDAYDDDDDEDY